MTRSKLTNHALLREGYFRSLHTLHGYMEHIMKCLAIAITATGA